MDTTQLVRQHQSIEYAPLSRGHIAGAIEISAGKPKRKTSVTAFTDQLLVILPGGSSEHLYGPCRWGAIHGTQLPAFGAECQVGVDETNHPVVLWWEGEQKEVLLAESVTEAMLVLAVQNKLNPGAWTNPEAFSGKLEKTETLQVRTEQGKTSARLKGIVTAKEAVPAVTTLWTLPVGFRPLEALRCVARNITAATTLDMLINTTGTCSVNEEIKAAQILNVHGITFNLT